MNLFNLDFGKLIKQLLPVGLRTVFNQLFLNAVQRPVQLLYASFLVYRAGVLYDLSHSSQVCRIEAVLNDAFDNVSRSIYITDAIYELDTYAFERLEGETMYIFERTEVPDVTYVFERTEVYSGGVDFVVNVPAAVVFDTPRMNRLTRKYKLPGRDYSIQII